MSVAVPTLATTLISVDQVRDPVEWPQNMVDKIIELAREAGVQGAEGAIDIIHQMLGNRGAIIEHAQFWSRVQNHLTGGSGALAYAQEKKGGVLSRWEGPAHTAFTGWETGMEEALKGMSTAALTMSKVVAGMLDEITKAYNTARTLIANTYANLLEHAPGLLESLPLPGRQARHLAAIKEVAQIIATFIRDVNQFANDVTMVLTEYQKTAIDVGHATGKIGRIPGLAGTAHVPSSWDLRDVG